MGGEWRKLPFSEAVLVNPTVRLERGRRYPFVDIGAVRPGSRCAYAIEEREFSGGGSRFQHGDTLMARITPCLENGKIARFCAHQGSGVAHGSTEFIVIRGRPGITDTNFAYYLTQWEEVRDYAICQMTGTSGRQRVPIDSLDYLVVPVPPLPEQRAIAHILGTLDDKIELNRRQNETLEAMARALFKAWFVDFEPVRAKLEGRLSACNAQAGWQPGQSLPGLPAHPACAAAAGAAGRFYDLFPDRLVESELGEIPEGWEITSLSEYSSLNPESWTKRTRPKQIRYVDLSNTKWGRVESVTNYEGDDAPSRAQRILRPLDTIVGIVRPGNGSYALISDEGLTGSTGFAVLRPLRRECAEFVYLAATSRENIERLSNLADGGAYPAVRPEIVSATHVPRVSQELINRFSQQVSPMIAGIAGNDRESRTLAQLRDALLPKLISGALRIQDAEAFLKERGL